MEQTVNLQLSRQEALKIVTAIGTHQNRVGQKARWAERKRIPSLDQEAKETTDEGGLQIIANKKAWTLRYIETAYAEVEKCNELRERIKQAVGIADGEKQQKIRDDFRLTIAEQDLPDFYYMVRWFTKNVGNTFHYLWIYLRKRYPNIAEAYGDSPEEE